MSEKEWIAQATQEQVAFVNQVRAECGEHYADGGDIIIECYSSQEIVDQFKSMNDVKEFLGLRIEKELNMRWGEDNDPELARAKRFYDW